MTCQSWQYAYNDPQADNLPGPKVGRSSNATTYDYPLRFTGCQTSSSIYWAPVYFKAGWSIRKTVCDNGYVAQVANNSSASCVLPLSPPFGETGDVGIPIGQSLPSDCATGSCPSREAATSEAEGALSADAGPTADSGLVGDPVNVANGNVFEQEVDYRGAGGNRLSFYRVYNSSRAAISSNTLGDGWRHNFDRRLYAGASYAQIVRADGRSLVFSKAGSAYVAPPGHAGSLVPVMNGSTQTGWLYKYPNGDTESYDYTYGNLQVIQLKAGGTLTLSWLNSLQLGGVSDGLGRSLQFTYGVGNRLSRATFPDSTWVEYGADSYRRLSTVMRSNVSGQRTAHLRRRRGDAEGG